MAKKRKKKGAIRKPGTYRVEPIRDLEAIRRIRRRLQKRTSQRDALLFCLGVNNGLRVGDLLALRVGQVRNVKVDQKIPIVEQKTGKPNFLVVNSACISILKAYLTERTRKDSDYLFQSQKGRNQPLTVRSASALIKKWCREEGLDGNYGSHSLRKTFGWVHRVHHRTDWLTLCERFQHASPAVTRLYLGISEDEVKAVLLKPI